MLSSLVEYRKFRGLLPFSGVMLMVDVSWLMSTHSRVKISPARAPVSFPICRNNAMCLLHAAIRSSISLSTGMNGSFLVVL